jgi:pimeloyl-ACP methyl ester carboxylesterase
LASGDGPAPYRDNETYRAGRLTFSWDKSAYAEATFAKADTYYVAVSGSNNKSYNPVTGSGDVAGSTGKYTLTVTPLIQNKPPRAGSNRIEGGLMLANPGAHVPEIGVFLERIETGGLGDGTILGGRTTWVLIHGRNDNSGSFASLASTIDRFNANDQVLVLDWRAGAGDNHIFDGQGLGLDGVTWGPLVGQWAAAALLKLGVQPKQVNVVGHSWGTYVGFELAKALKGVNRFVALDPARTATQYDVESVRFDQYASRSWAFYGNGLYGSPILAATATEEFFLKYADGAPSHMTAHWAPVRLFERLIQDQLPGGTSWGPKEVPFGLDDLLRDRHGPWNDNTYQYAAGVPFKEFEVRFTVTLSSTGSQTKIKSIADIEYSPLT